MKQDELNTKLLSAAGRGEIDKVRSLLDAGADINVRDSNQQTPLLRAAAFGFQSVIIELVYRGADVKVIDENKQNVLHLAANSWVSPSTIKLLLSEGADIHARDNRNQTPISIIKGFESIRKDGASEMLDNMGIKEKTGRARSDASAWSNRIKQENPKGGGMSL